MHPLKPLAALLLLAATAAMAQPTAPSALGRWITESGNLEVDIAPCGDALCGTVVRVLANRSMSAPGAELQPADGKPALGMQILSDLRAGAAGEFEGQIYNRENGKHYAVVVQPAEPDQLRVHGYVGLRLFGKTQVWRRPATAGAAR